MSTSMSAALETDQKKTAFYPLDFEPTDTDVIVGKGKNCFVHSGNKKLRQLLASRLLDYAAASRKKEKSEVLTSIVDEFRKGEGAFVQKDCITGLWYDANDTLARDKVSRILRRALLKQKIGKEERNRDKIASETCKMSSVKINPLQYGRESNCASNNISLQNFILDSFRRNDCFQSSSPDESISDSLGNFIEKFALYFPEKSSLDKNPLEPNPIPEYRKNINSK